MPKPLLGPNGLANLFFSGTTLTSSDTSDFYSRPRTVVFLMSFLPYFTFFSAFSTFTFEDDTEAYLNEILRFTTYGATTSYTGFVTLDCGVILITSSTFYCFLLPFKIKGSTVYSGDLET